MYSDKDFAELFNQLKKHRYTIDQEIELYRSIEFLAEKYKDEFFKWYVKYEKEYHKSLPEITIPNSLMELEIKEINKIIKNPKGYSFEEKCEYEKLVCDYLATNIIRHHKYTHHNKNDLSTEYMEMDCFLNRYEFYRPFYMVRFQLKYAPDFE
jgi:hypothetical protein